MKKEKLFVKLIFLLQLLCCCSFALKCWHCATARNKTECIENGFERTCNIKQVCMTQTSHENGKNFLQMSCKQKRACHQLSVESIKSKKCSIDRLTATNSTTTTKSSPSKCFSCCSYDICNLHEIAGSENAQKAAGEPPQAPPPSSSDDATEDSGNQQFHSRNLLQSDHEDHLPFLKEEDAIVPEMIAPIDEFFENVDEFYDDDVVESHDHHQQILNDQEERNSNKDQTGSKFIPYRKKFLSKNWYAGLLLVDPTFNIKDGDDNSFQTHF